jgi:hypothetical protein
MFYSIIFFPKHLVDNKKLSTFAPALEMNTGGCFWGLEDDKKLIQQG